MEESEKRVLAHSLSLLPSSRRRRIRQIEVLAERETEVERETDRERAERGGFEETGEKEVCVGDVAG